MRFIWNIVFGTVNGKRTRLDFTNLKGMQRIFVPLCGKTRDIGWLLSNDCEVVGAELSEVAIIQLFEELGVEPTVTITSNGKIYAKDGLTIYVGDIFKLTSSNLGDVTGIYDRAALVALPSPLREQLRI